MIPFVPIVVTMIQTTIIGVAINHPLFPSILPLVTVILHPVPITILIPIVNGTVIRLEPITRDILNLHVSIPTFAQTRSDTVIIPVPSSVIDPII